MKTDQFIKIIANSLNDIVQINKKITKDNLIINNINLDLLFLPDSQIKNLNLKSNNDLFMDKYKNKSYFKMSLTASIK